MLDQLNKKQILQQLPRKQNIQMHHPYTSNHKNIASKYPSNSELENLNYLYPRYEHTRRKTQWMEPSIDYNILYSDRNQLYLRLEEEKLYNKRSMLIIEDLLEEKKKMELLESKEKNITMELEKVNKNIRDKILNKRTEGTLSFRQEKYKKLNYSPQTDKQKNSSKYYESVITKTSPHPPPTINTNKNKTKQQIMKKLFDSEQPPKQKIATLIKNPQNISLVVKEKDRQRANTQVNVMEGSDREKQTQLDILRQEVRFLKEELNQKNKCIVDYKCQIVRLQRIEKIMGNLLKKQEAKSPTKSQEKKTDKEKRAELKFDVRCINVLVINKKPKKYYSKSNRSIISIEKKQEQEKIQIQIPEIEDIKQVQVQVKKQTTEAEAQTQLDISSPCLERSEVKLQLSSNIIDIGSRIGESEVDFYLTPSEYPSINSKIIENGKNSQESATQIMMQEDLEVQIEKYEQNCQTDSVQVKQQGCQTTENYEHIIEEEYLQWLFEKDYEQMQKKKKASAQQPTKN